MSSRFDFVVNVFLLAAAAAVLYGVVLRPDRAAPTQKPAIEDLSGVELKFRQNTLSGSQDARVVVLEFSDFECTFCARFHNETFPKLRDEFLKTGRVGYVQVHHPNQSSHPVAFQAAEAIECARDMGKAAELTTVLFSKNARIRTSDFSDGAEGLGIDRSDFERCLARGKRDLVNKDIAIAEQAGIRATPTFFIGRVVGSGVVQAVKKINGARGYDVFRTALLEMF